MLKSIMGDPGAVDSGKVAAARTLLELGLNAAELELILSRIDELERKIDDEKDSD